MGNTSFRFLTAFFEMTLAWIVFANYFGWSGAYLNLGSYVSSWNTNTYFGFSSISMFLEDFGHVMNQSGAWNYQNFLRELEGLGSAITFGVLRFFTTIANGVEFDITTVVMIVLEIFIQPLMITYRLIIISLYIIIYIIGFITIILRLLGGYYNVDFYDTSSIWRQWDYLSSEWNWSAIAVPIV